MAAHVRRAITRMPHWLYYCRVAGKTVTLPYNRRPWHSPDLKVLSVGRCEYHFRNAYPVPLTIEKSFGLLNHLVVRLFFADAIFEVGGVGMHLDVFLSMLTSPCTLVEGVANHDMNVKKDLRQKGKNGLTSVPRKIVPIDSLWLFRGWWNKMPAICVDLTRNGGAWRHIHRGFQWLSEENSSDCRQSGHDDHLHIYAAASQLQQHLPSSHSFQHTLTSVSPRCLSNHVAPPVLFILGFLKAK